MDLVAQFLRFVVSLPKSLSTLLSFPLRNENAGVSVKGECVALLVCNLKGSIIHIINLSLNATKRADFLIKMGLEVFNCMSLQNTIKVYKDWLSSHHDTSQDIHPGQASKINTNPSRKYTDRGASSQCPPWHETTLQFMRRCGCEEF